MTYFSVNEQENVPEHVVEEMNELHISDRGIEMGRSYPPLEEEEEGKYGDFRDDPSQGWLGP